MISKIVNEINALQEFEIGAFTIGLRLKSPLDSNTAMKGLIEIQKKFGELSESDFDSDENIFRLKNDEIKRKQLLFQLSKFQAIDVGFGADSNFDVNRHLKELFNIVQKAFTIFPINIEWIDCKLIVESNAEKNHFSAFWQSFFKNSPIYGLFEQNKIAQDSLKLRSFITDETVGVLSIRSDVSDNEVLKNEYEDDTLLVSLGIARIKRIPFDENIEETVYKHFIDSISFIERKLIKHVLKPLDIELSK